MHRILLCSNLCMVQRCQGNTVCMLEKHYSHENQRCMFSLLNLRMAYIFLDCLERMGHQDQRSIGLYCMVWE